MLIRHLPAAPCLAVLLVATSATWSSAGPPPERVVYSACYMPDAVDYAGNILLHIHNPTSQPLTVAEITLDGQSIGRIWTADESFLEPGVRDEYIRIENDRLAWYRVFPNPIPPGGITEVILRLVPQASVEPESSLSVTLHGYDPVETTVAMSEPAFSLEYVGIEAGLDVLHLYTHAQPGADVEISRVEIDGRPVAADIHRVYSGFSYARVALDQPWQKGAFHAVGIGTADELRAVLIRALPTPAPLAIMGNTQDRVLEEYRNKLFQANIAFGPAPVETYERLARYDLGGAYIYRRYLKPDEERKKEPAYYDQFDYGENRGLEQIRAQPSLAAYFLEDEPDGRYHHTDLPRGSISRDVERANQFCRVFDPDTPTYLQIDHGGYPRNLYIYGQIADYVCTHAYPLGGDGVITATRDHVFNTRNASRPRPFYYLNEGYCRNEQREFDPDEMRIETYTALATGAKSLQWYPAHGDRGLLKHPTMWTAVGAMNGVLHQVLPLLSIGVPLTSPSVEGGNLLSSAILCGDKALAVVLVNQDFSADAESFALRPAQAVVRVRLPGFMKATGVAEVNFPGQTAQIPSEISGSSVAFATEVQAGKILVIYSDGAVLEQMRDTHARCLQRFIASPEAE